MMAFQKLCGEDGVTPHAISLFRSIIWRYYRRHGRGFPWRETDDPYSILVSEIMLQQTQTSRVVSKYNEFLSVFPDFFELARAPLRDVLQIWQGLGYNHRALALRRTAQEIVAQFDGELPPNPKVLQKLPGIGPYTAAAVAAIAFNKPTVFVETNIRTVFRYFFFARSDRVTDGDILTLVEATVDREKPREWYYALFDYGAMVKRRRKAIPSTAHHTRSTFRGSNREIRGHVIRILVTRQSIAEQELMDLLNQNRERVREILSGLYGEGLIDMSGGLIRIG